MPLQPTPEPRELKPAKVGPKVAVGATTLVGWSSSSAAFIAAAVALIAGDHTEATVGTVVAGVAGLVILAVTQAGRYLQSHAAIRSNVGITAGVVADELEQHRGEVIDAVVNSVRAAFAQAKAANRAIADTSPPDGEHFTTSSTEHTALNEALSRSVPNEDLEDEAGPPDEVITRPESATTPDDVPQR